MKSRAINTTKEQDAFRAAILGKKARQVKLKPIASPYQPSPRIVYMQNCLLWVKEYEAGRADKERVKRSLNMLKEHCNLYLTELQIDTTKL